MKKLLMHWYHRLCHSNINSIQEMAKKGILPKEIENCKKPMCVYFKFSKAHKKSSEKDNQILKMILLILVT